MSGSPTGRDASGVRAEAEHAFERLLLRLVFLKTEIALRAVVQQRHASGIDAVRRW